MTTSPESRILDDDHPDVVEFYRNWMMTPIPQLCRPTMGLRAAGYREGFHRGTRDAMRRIWPLLDEDGRRAAQAIVSSLPEESA